MTRGDLLHTFPFYDRAPVNRYVSRFPHHVDSDSGPRSYHHRDINSVPRPLSNGLPGLQSEKLRGRRNLGWNIDFAVAYLVKHLEENTSDLSTCLARIRRKAQHIVNDYGCEGIAFHTFNQLDQSLFAGHLKNAVYLTFDSLGTDASGTTFTHGRGPNPRVRHISIVLNLDVQQRASAGQVLASLIHHMIHAYLLVACGPQENMEEGYGRLAHGIHFAKILRTIKKLSAAKDRPLPIGFGHPLHTRAYHSEYNPRPLPHKSLWFCSHCYPEVDPVPEVDVNKYYERVCRPLLDLPDVTKGSRVSIYNKRDELEEVPRARAPPSADSVEFIFQEKEVVLVPDDKINAFLSVRRAFDRSKTRYLVVPDEVPREAFLSLLQLLHTGAYGPDLGPVIASAGRKCGAPVIKPMYAKAPAYLLTDVRMFKLGCEMSFDDCKHIALDRLSAQHTTREDPIAVLQAIYEGGDPDNDIRDWVKRFLIRVPDEESWAGRGGVPEPPNLIKLEQSMDLRERWLELLETSSALQIDVMKVKDHLVNLGRIRSYRAIAARPFPTLPVDRGMGMSMGMGGSHNYLLQDVERMGMGFGPDKYRATGVDSSFGSAMRYIGTGDILGEW